MRFRKKTVICSHGLSLCVAILYVVVGRRSHHASLAQAKRDRKMEKIRLPNDALKGYLKNAEGYLYRVTNVHLNDVPSILLLAYNDHCTKCLS